MNFTLCTDYAGITQTVTDNYTVRIQKTDHEGNRTKDIRVL